jgi:hypothetical protein
MNEWISAYLIPVGNEYCTNQLFFVSYLLAWVIIYLYKAQQFGSLLTLNL